VADRGQPLEHGAVVTDLEATVGGPLHAHVPLLGQELHRQLVDDLLAEQGEDVTPSRGVRDAQAPIQGVAFLAELEGVADGDLVVLLTAHLDPVRG
jgi:hypothetical protein